MVGLTKSMRMNSILSPIKKALSAEEHSLRQIQIFGLVMACNFPLYYVIWLFTSPGSIHAGALRILATLICLSLIAVPYWPRLLKKVIPVYWRISVMYCLPFFFTYMTLRNHCSTLWLMNTVSALFFTLLLFDLFEFTLITVAGVAIGLLCYKLNHHPIVIEPGNITPIGLIATYTATIIIGAIFAYTGKDIEKAKYDSMSRIAHELRSPLAGIDLYASGLEDDLPLLIDTYNKAVASNLIDNEINPKRLSLMRKSLTNIRFEVKNAFSFIDILLMNIKQFLNRHETKSTRVAIDECVIYALERYPFQPEQRELIHYRNEGKFEFIGDQLLITHVLFNLIKNSLYYIASANRGEITIRYATEEETGNNIVFFKDTGPGIPADELPYIFNRFYSKTPHGSGIGLAFSKTVMKNLGGDIICHSEFGNFTEFMLIFPKVMNQAN